MHVVYGEKTAKYWLDPVELAGSYGFAAHELNRLRLTVIEHRITFTEKWHEHLSSSPGVD